MARFCRLQRYQVYTFSASPRQFITLTLSSMPNDFTAMLVAIRSHLKKKKSVLWKKKRSGIGYQDRLYLQCKATHQWVCGVLIHSISLLRSHGSLYRAHLSTFHVWFKNVVWWFVDLWSLWYKFSIVSLIEERMKVRSPCLFPYIF